MEEISTDLTIGLAFILVGLVSSDKIDSRGNYWTTSGSSIFYQQLQTLQASRYRRRQHQAHRSTGEQIHYAFMMSPSDMPKLSRTITCNAIISTSNHIRIVNGVERRSSSRVSTSLGNIVFANIRLTPATYSRCAFLRLLPHTTPHRQSM